MKKIIGLCSIFLFFAVSVSGQILSTTTGEKPLSIILENSRFEKRFLQKGNGSVLEVRLFSNKKKRYYLDCREKINVNELKEVQDDDVILDTCSCSGIASIKQKGAIHVSINPFIIKDLFVGQGYLQTSQGGSKISFIIINNSSFGIMKVSAQELHTRVTVTRVHGADTTIMVSNSLPIDLSPVKFEVK
jgi:hypothetical protein